MRCISVLRGKMNSWCPEFGQKRIEKRKMKSLTSLISIRTRNVSLDIHFRRLVQQIIGKYCKTVLQDKQGLVDNKPVLRKDLVSKYFIERNSSEILSNYIYSAPKCLFS